MLGAVVLVLLLRAIRNVVRAILRRLSALMTMLTRRRDTRVVNNDVRQRKKGGKYSPPASEKTTPRPTRDMEAASTVRRLSRQTRESRDAEKGLERD